LWYEFRQYSTILLPRAMDFGLSSPFGPLVRGMQLSKSYAPFKGQCVGILEGCCGMSFDHTTPSFSLVPLTLVLFSIWLIS
jgi:hypothetical protein